MLFFSCFLTVWLNILCLCSIRCIYVRWPQKFLKCLKCLNPLHIKCSTVDNRQYLSYKNGKKEFTFQYCTDYSYLKCDKHVYDRQLGIPCNISNLWVYRSCAGIGKKEYEDLQNSDNDDKKKTTLWPLFMDGVQLPQG